MDVVGGECGVGGCDDEVFIFFDEVVWCVDFDLDVVVV